MLSILNMGNNLLDIVFLIVSALLSENDGCVAFLFVAIYFCVLAIFVRICLLKIQRKPTV